MPTMYFGHRIEYYESLHRHTVYALLEPNSDTVRYVGCTKKTADQRLKMHLSCARRRQLGPPVTQWVRWLLANGKQPDVCILTSRECYSEHAAYLEQYWIDHHAKRGCDLLNVYPVHSVRKCKKYEDLVRVERLVKAGAVPATYLPY